MILTVCSDNKTWTFDVGMDITLQEFKVVCSGETEIPSDKLKLLFNNKLLSDNTQPLKHYGVGENDILLIQQDPIMPNPPPPRSNFSNVPAIDFSRIQIPSSSGASAPRVVNNGVNRNDEPAKVREWFLNNPHDLALLKERNPTLADALLSGDLNRFAAEFKKIRDAREQAEKESIQLRNANPMDPEVQRKIAAEIERKNIDENMNMAIEESPESFGQVVMLWINLRVNNHHVKAFVDSGAQTTIMSSDCAKRCNIMRLVDRRFEGIAKGVGTQKILGRIHLAQIQIEDVFLQCSFSVLEDQSMDVLLGLDMLRRHLCVIDLRENCLMIGTSQTKTKFLSETDLPSHNRLHNPSEEEDISKAVMESVEDAKKKQDAEKRPTSATTTSDAKMAKASHSDQPSSSRSPEKPSEFYLNIQKLVDMGFNEFEAEAELNSCNGDLQKAIANILTRNIQS
uniref:UBA domain-containing protein n=1 Tax=Ciona savignyi TaxID=51511 RepID=H2ZAJ1_CIOSA